jgi:hypothetical protein
MAENQRARHPEREGVRGGAAYAVQPFDNATEVEWAGVDQTADLESNELHPAVGTDCARCGQPMSAQADIRRTTAGTFVHEECPAGQT